MTLQNTTRIDLRGTHEQVLPKPNELNPWKRARILESFPLTATGQPTLLLMPNF